MIGPALPSTHRLRRRRTAQDAVSEVCPAHERARTPAWAFAVCLSVLLLAPVSSLALESEPTRESYVASVEPICKANKQASDRYLKGVRALVKNDKLKPAAARFTKAAAALEQAHRQLVAVPQPPADEAKLAKWLAGIKSEAALMRTIATKLKAGKAGAASSLSVRLTHDATTTNNHVIAFAFNYCRIDPSRYA